MRFLLIFLALLTGACNLSNDAPTGPTTIPILGATATPLPLQDNAPATLTPLPGVNGVLPTRTPIGFSGPATPLNNAPGVPTSPTGESAQITIPANGSAVNIGTLQISGFVNALAQDQFTLELVAQDGRVLNSQLITLRNPNQVDEVPWSAAMTTGDYTGPAEVRLSAPTPSGLALLARVSITLVSGGAAPSGPSVGANATSPTGSITVPAANAVVTGGTLQVSGTAGGIAENQFVLALVANNQVINSQIVTLTNPNYTNVVPWSASLGTSGYTGPAEIRLMTVTAFASVSITIQ